MIQIEPISVENHQSGNVIQLLSIQPKLPNRISIEKSANGPKSKDFYPELGIDNFKKKKKRKNLYNYNINII